MAPNNEDAIWLMNFLNECKNGVQITRLNKDGKPIVREGFVRTTLTISVSELKEAILASQK